MAYRALSLLLLFLSLGQAAAGNLAARTGLGGSLYLVNPDFPLPAAYVPADLRKPRVRSLNGEVRLREEAAAALEEMFAAALSEERLTLRAVSGYRSYGRQQAIFARKRNAVGEKRARLLVAPPGASEHQLGLAVDIGGKTSATLSEAFGASREGIWVARNAHRFGFVIRYKGEWTGITGYAAEPWHLRYVGKEHAERMYQMEIPLETYVELLSEAVFSGFAYPGG